MFLKNKLLVLLIIMSGLHPLLAQVTDKYKGGEQKGKNTQRESLAFPPLSKLIYKKGWIDFNKNGKKDIYEDPQQSIEKRVADLLQQMNTAEKTNQLATLYGYGAVLKDRLPTPAWKDSIWKDGIANIDEQLTGLRKDTLFAFPYADHVIAINMIQRWFIENTRLGIPVDFTTEGIRGLNHMKATYFPSQLAQACTFDKNLIYEIGKVTGQEAYALGYTNVYSPILDVATDPRWGRIEETYGSDPFLVSTLGVQNTKGIQSQGIASTGKHFAIYSIPIGGRDGWVRANPYATMRQVRTYYLEPFRRAIKDAGMMGVMVSYNDYNGIPIIASKLFLTDILRKEFGFKGYTVSDSHAFEDLIDKYHVASDTIQAALLALSAGLNVKTSFESPDHFILALRRGIQAGILPISLIDERVREVLEVKFRLGLFDIPYKDTAVANKVVHSNTAKNLALEAARQSIVLLKNDHSLLPLQLEKYNCIAVIGPNAKEQKSLSSRYGPVKVKVPTLYDALKTALPGKTLVYAEGCKHIDKNFPESDLYPFPIDNSEQQLFNEAVQVASGADLIIISIGDNEKTVGEGASRLSLNLPGKQDLLIEKLTALGKPIVLIHTGGRPASMNIANKQVDAVIENFYAGEANGRAVAEVITGIYNPSGKLPIGILKSAGQIPLTFPMMTVDDNGGNAQVTGFLYPFGHGLSYSSFEYTNLQIDTSRYGTSQKIRVSFSVKNTGSRTGIETPQVYIHDELSSVAVFAQELCGFEKVQLQPGETKVIPIEIDKSSLELYNENMHRVIEPGKFNIMVGASSTDIRLRGSFEIR